MKSLWAVADKYYSLSDTSKTLLAGLAREKLIAKDQTYLRTGEIPKYFSFIKSGLLSYFYTDRDGNKIIKRFFAENSFTAATSALITKTTSLFTIQALEETHVIQFNFNDFMELVYSHHDIALLYIKYLEKNWVIDKEPDEIILKQQTAKQRYLEFINTNNTIVNRLKQHQIASYLAITPTQLSRIRAEI
ncbi:Crp/Fnr family transcriptional regulator [Mucilaginibacter sp.]|uniref:Crp/Fnr family transcriptional regulator n=1 Tax=Mucilaginibacter sp. TaxID=1882438 RepID=UPI003D152ED1